MNLLPSACFALDPNFAAMRLDESFRDRESETHTRCVAIDADKVFENFLMMFGSDAGAGVLDGNFNAIGARQAKATALLLRHGFGNAALPEVRGGAQA